MAKLIIREKGKERVHEIVDDVTSIGRSSANIIKIRSRKASRQHCRVERAGEDFRVVDLGSRNGIEVNGVKVASQTLRVGDQIAIGGTRIIFEQAVEMTADEIGATVAADLPAEGASVPAAEIKPVEEKEKAKPKYVLEVTAGRGKGETVELGEEAVTLGRHKSNTLQIDDEAASNYHAEIRREDGRWVVADLGSTNGTRVAGEKIVKTPLAPGIVIGIGNTEIVFKNLGAPEAGEAVFGTVVLDQDRLDAQLRAAAETAPSPLAAFARLVGILLVLGLCGGGAYLAVRKIRGRPGGRVEPFNRPGNLVANASFSGGTDAEGAPKGWRRNASHPRSDVRLDPAEHHDPAPEGGEAFALRLARADDARGDALLACETAEGIPVDRAKRYELSGFVKSGEGGGLYGLAAEWRDGQRRTLGRHYETVSGSQPEWKQLVGHLRPPPGAASVKVACVAFGNQGSVWFDDVFFGETRKDVPVRAAVRLENGGVDASFSPAGELRVKRAGAEALRGGFVLVGQGGLQASQELARVEAGYPREEGAQHLFQVKLFDFARSAYARLALAASTAPGGVRTRWTLASDGSLTADRATLVFQVQPAYAASDAVVYTDEGKEEKLAEGEASGVSEIVFAGAQNSLALDFQPAARVRLTAAPPTKRLEVVLAEPATLTTRPASYTVGILSGSQTRRRQAEAALAKLQEARQKQEYRVALEQADLLLKRYAGFEDLCREARGARSQIERLGRGAETALGDHLRRVERAAEAAALQAAVTEAEAFIAEKRPLWAGTIYEKTFADAVHRIAKRKDDFAREAREQEAERKWDAVRQGWKPDDPRRFEAIPLLRARINLLVRDYEATRAAASAKKFLEEVLLPAEEQGKKVYGIHDRLKAAAQNYERNGRIKEAIGLIEKDPEYQKHKADLPDLAEYLEELRKQLE